MVKTNLTKLCLRAPLVTAYINNTHARVDVPMNLHKTFGPGMEYVYLDPQPTNTGARLVHLIECHSLLQALA